MDLVKTDTSFGENKKNIIEVCIRVGAVIFG